MPVPINFGTDEVKYGAAVMEELGLGVPWTGADFADWGQRVCELNDLEIQMVADDEAQAAAADERNARQALVYHQIRDALAEGSWAATIGVTGTRGAAAAVMAARTKLVTDAMKATGSMSGAAARLGIDVETACRNFTNLRHGAEGVLAAERMLSACCSDLGVAKVTGVPRTTVANWRNRGLGQAAPALAEAA